MKWLAQGHRTNQRDILETTDRFSSILEDAISVVGGGQVTIVMTFSVCWPLDIILEAFSAHHRSSVLGGGGGMRSSLGFPVQKPRLSRLLLQVSRLLGERHLWGVLTDTVNFRVCLSTEESGICGFWSFARAHTHTHACKFKHPQRLKVSCRWNYNLLGATP